MAAFSNAINRIATFPWQRLNASQIWCLRSRRRWHRSHFRFHSSVISGLQRICMIILSGCLMLCITIRSIDCGIPAARLVRVGQSAIAICSMIFLTGQTQSMSWTTMSSILFGRTLIWHSHSTLNSCLCPLQWHTEAYCDVSYLFETKAVGTLETWMIEDISSPSHPYLIGQMWDSGIQMRNLSEGIV